MHCPVNILLYKYLCLFSYNEFFISSKCLINNVLWQNIKYLIPFV